MRFRGCSHATALDLRRLRGEDLQPAEDSADMALLQDKGAEHENRFLKTLRESGGRLIEIVTKDRPTAELLAETKAALRSGNAGRGSASAWRASSKSRSPMTNLASL